MPENTMEQVSKLSEGKEKDVPDVLALVEFPVFLTKESGNRVIIVLMLFLGTLVYPIALTLLYGFIGFVLTYQLYYKYGALKAGDPAWGMLKYDGYHVHHWAYCSIILTCLWLGGLLHPFSIGLCFGGIVHGIQYPDWLQFSGQTEPQDP
jgi:hypothetical protein